MSDQAMALETSDITHKYDVFISYSRKQQQFVEKLEQKLEARNIHCYLDKNDTPKASQFAEELILGIDNSSTFLAVLTPDYISSDYCNAEIQYAFAKDAFIIPLLYINPFEPKQPEVLDKITEKILQEGIIIDVKENIANIQKRNYIFVEDHPTSKELSHLIARRLPSLNQQHTLFSTQLRLLYDDEDDPHDFDKNIVAFYTDQLIDPILEKIISTIRKYDEDLRIKSELHVKLKAWQQKEGNLLSGKELRRYLSWIEKDWVAFVKRENLASTQDKPILDLPVPTEAQRNFVKRSRFVEQLKNVSFVSALISISIILLLLSIFALIQRNTAIDNKNLAEANEQIAEENARIAENNAIQIGYQLQTLALVQNIKTINTGIDPLTPLLVNEDIWIANEEDGTIQAFAIADGATRMEPIAIGANPLEPVGYSIQNMVFAASTTDRRISQISTTNYTLMQTLDIDHRVIDMTLARNQWLWVTTTRAVIQINAGTLEINQEIALNNGIDAPVVDDTYLWVRDRQGNGWWQIHSSTGEVHFLLNYENDSITTTDTDAWFSNNNVLTQIDPLDRSIKNTFMFDGNITRPIFDGRYLWFIEKVDDREQIVQLFPDNGEIQRVELVETDNQIHIVKDYIIAINDNTVTAFFVSITDNDIQYRWTTTVENVQSFLAPTSDTQQLWFADVQGQNITVLRLSDGVNVRTVPVCRGARPPVFDGANMWVSCSNPDIDSERSGQGSLRAIPAFQFYHGNGQPILNLEFSETNSRPHTPYLMNNQLWVVQEIDGRLIVYDTIENCIIGSIAVGTYPALPYFDSTLLPEDPAYQKFWIEVELVNADNTPRYTLQRFDTGRDWECNDPNFAADVVIDLELEPGRLHRIGHELWVDLFASTISTDVPYPNIQFIDLENNILLEDSIDSEGTITGPVYHPELDPNAVWLVNISNVSASLDTLEIDHPNRVLQTIEINQLAYPPLVLEDEIWLSAPCQGGLLTCTSIIFDQSFSGSLTKIDTNNNELSIVNQITFERAPSQPYFGGDYVWLSFTTEPPIVTADYTRGFSDLTAYDRDTLEVVASFNPCPNILPPYFDENTNLLWVHCIGFDDAPSNLWIIDVSQSPPSIYQQHEALGTQAWPLVHLDYPQLGINEIWISFAGSETVARFDAATGALIRRYWVGQGASPIVMDNNEFIWIANAQDGTIQYIYRD